MIRGEHDSYLGNYLHSGNAKIMGVGRDVEAVHKNGQPLPVRLAIGHVRLPDEDVFVAFITDLSARRQMEQALQDNEAKLRSLLSNIPGRGLSLPIPARLANVILSVMPSAASVDIQPATLCCPRHAVHGWR